MRETIPSPNGPGEIRLGKVMLVMKGQKDPEDVNLQGRNFKY